MVVTGNMKILSYVNSGLNDIFSNIAYNIDFCFNQKIALSNLHIYTDRYEPLNNFFNFKEIVFLTEKPDLSSYNIVSDFHKGSHTNFNIKTSKHISNFICLKEEFVNLIPNFSDHVGFHFRYQRPETSKFTVEEETEFLLKRFHRHYSDYNKGKNFVIYSDNFDIQNVITNYPDVKVLTPTCNINGYENLEERFLMRKKDTLNAILTFHSMATCLKLYKLYGQFTNLAKMVNPDITISEF
jgi:hypothetical protein